MNILGWLWYLTVQLIMAFFTVLGWFVLIPFCLGHAWTLSTLVGSIKDGRPIDHWNTEWLRWAYDNPEDGVSGQQALIWLNSTTRGLYMPMPEASFNEWQTWLYAAWRAYCWSAWRNSTDNLKYRFAWKAGPFAVFKLGAFIAKLGWQGGLPVLSISR